jgi:hypothetical protein
MTNPSPPEILREIRQRYAEAKPLNLSAIKNAAPHLLEGLWNPENFKGWRQRLDEAGVDYDRITFLLDPIAVCPICGHKDLYLHLHFANVHKMTTDAVQEQFPAAESRSEETRTRKFNTRHGVEGATIVPHWEKAWSREYALDRLRYFHENGHSVNPGNLLKKEGALAGYLRRLYGVIDHALQAAGIPPESVRLNAKRKLRDSESILEELRQIHAKDAQDLHMARARTEIRPLVTHCFKEYGSYEAALSKAGIDAKLLIPGLSDAPLLKLQQKLIAEAKQRIATKPPYVAKEIAAFLKEYDTVVEQLYGSWQNVAASFGVEEVRLFNSPSYQNYLTTDQVFAAIRERQAVGLPIRYLAAKADNGVLVRQATKFFPQWEEAVEAAGVEYPMKMQDHRTYTKESLIAYLQDKHRKGITMWSTSFRRKGEDSDPLILKWVVRYFGNWAAALKAAGIPIPSRPRAAKWEFTERFPNDENILAAVKGRWDNGDPVDADALRGPAAQGGDLELLFAVRGRFGSWHGGMLAAGLPDTRRKPVRKKKGAS